MLQALSAFAFQRFILAYLPGWPSQPAFDDSEVRGIRGKKS